MKKKYPFSKKAITAILAATVAFSPVVSFGGVFEEHRVEAASSDAITRVTTIYSHLGNGATVLFNDAAEGLKDFNTDDWRTALTDSVASKIDDELKLALGDDTTLKAEDIAKRIALLVYGSTATNIGDQLDAFKSSPEGLAFEEIVGDNSIDLIVQFLVDTEKNLWSTERLTQLEDGTSVDVIAAEIRDDLIEANPSTYGELNNKLYTKMGTNLEGLISIKDRINETLVAKTVITSTEITTLRNAFVFAALLAGNPNTVIPPGGTVPPPVEEPEQGEVTVPTGSTAVEKETTTSGQVEVVTTVPAAKVADIVKAITAEKSVIPLTLEKPAAGETAKAQLPAALFTEAAQKNAAAVVNVKTAEASYQLPASEIKVADLAAKLGVPAADVQITISVNVVKPEVVQAQLDQNKLEAVSDVIEFTVKAVSGNKEEHITNFSYYVPRTIVGKTNFNVNRAAAVRLDENGKYRGVPAVFDGPEATILFPSNSKYVIVENDKTFTDIDNGKNFAEASIEKLASKYIIFGKSETSYAPSDAITRGEFAALISRSLGLVAKDPTALKFPDVPTTKAVNQNGEINAAAEAGIISGYGDGKFQPDKKINRAEAAIMIAKAMNYTKVPATKLDTTKKVSTFKDTSSIGSTSRTSVEKVYQAGIMSGFGTGDFGPDKLTQRDQMAVVLDKLLKAAALIN